MRESKIEAYLVQQVEAKGALQRKLQYVGRRGASDRMVVWPPFKARHPNTLDMSWHHVDFVELKAPGQKPDGHQKREHKRLRELGCNVFVIDSYEAVDAYVKGRS